MRSVGVMPRYPTALFDLDGTLIDSIGLIVDSCHHTFATFGLPRRRDEEHIQGIGTPLAAQFAPWAPDAATLEAMIATYRSYNLEHHDSRVRAYPGIARAMEALRAEGIRIGLVTSKIRPTAQRGLRAAGLDGIMEVMVCAEDTQNHKPHREPVDRALTQLGAAPDATIFVGDSVHDMRAGRAAAVPTAAALWGPFPRADLAATEPTHWLTSPDDILAVVLG